jgi:hypothetical protein
LVVLFSSTTLFKSESCNNNLANSNFSHSARFTLFLIESHTASINFPLQYTISFFIILSTYFQAPH